MFEKFLSGNAENFRQRYEGTFGFYRDEKGKRILTRIDSVGRVCQFVDSKGVTYSLNPDTQSDIGFLFLPPRAEYYNTNEGAMYVQKLAQRQWSRGISARNTSIHKLKDKGLTAVPVDFPALAAIYDDEKTPSFKEAFARFMAKGGSVAISRQFALAGGNVYLFMDIIGAYNISENQKCHVALKDPTLWRTELSDAFRSLEHSAEIT